MFPKMEELVRKLICSFPSRRRRELGGLNWGRIERKNLILIIREKSTMRSQYELMKGEKETSTSDKRRINASTKAPCVSFFPPPSLSRDWVGERREKKEEKGAFCRKRFEITET